MNRDCRTSSSLHQRVRTLLCAIGLLGWVGGCGAAPRLIERDASDLKAANGVSLNGVSLNGVSLNGVSLNGVSLNGVSLNGVSLNGVSLNGVSAEGGSISGWSGSSSKTGTALVGALMTGLLSDGSTVQLRIDAARKGSKPDAEVYFYKVSYQTQEAWSPLCGTAGDSAIEAVALAGRWNNNVGVVGGGAWINDTTAMTFGCVGRALAKCVLLGYKPWKTHDGVSLRPYHQACTRLMRADYCGDGTPYTVDGTLVNLYDDEDIQHDTESWGKEAEWDANGARCVAPVSALRLQLLGIPVPQCVTNRVLTNCGTFRDGTLLVTEYLH